MRILNFVCAITFMILAFLSTSVSNPILWILLYGIMSVICIMAGFDVYYKSLIAVVTIVVIICLVPAYATGHAWIHSNGSPIYFSEAKEFLVLCLCLFILIVQGIRSFRKA